MDLSNPKLFKQQCYINGRWTNASSSETSTVVNPFDKSVIGHIPIMDASEADFAIQAADKALVAWKALTAKERGAYLQKWAGLIDDNREDLARIMTIEQGKSIAESRSEIDYANSFIKWYAEEAKRVYGDVIPSVKKDQRLLVIKQPIGVCVAITPWNFPAAMITRKCAPALAAGCTMVVKPSGLTPFSALALAYLAHCAGIPDGVLNIITGDSKTIGKVFCANPIVRKLSFTGSTAVGKTLMQQCAETLKKVSLELGGNAPFIVFDDANLDKAVEGVMASKFRNSGQTCVCVNRVYVQASVYDEFAKKLLVAVKQLRLGNGLNEDTQQGPLINQDAVHKVKRHIEDALSKGATLLCGGHTDKTGPLFFEPTILTDMTADMIISTEETFGPVAPLFKFDGEEEVIELANATEFGLASYFYSQDVHRVFRVAEQLESGMVGINEGIISNEASPFGGIKESGMGREGSKYGIEEYLVIKYLCFG
jgi:succinate-semialdehyde dehydrogenase/glutarate-semialdehyde dehydrogenase